MNPFGSGWLSEQETLAIHRSMLRVVSEEGLQIESEELLAVVNRWSRSVR